MSITLNPNRFAFSCHAVWLLGWLSAVRSTSSPAFKSMPFDTRLFDSLVLRVITISSGVTRRKSASILRVFSRPSPSFARLSDEGSRSMSFVIVYSVSMTGADEGHRFAAFSIVSSLGMTNCSRTAAQYFSSGDAGVGGSFAGAPTRAQDTSGVTNGAAPLMANRRAKSRRFMDENLRGDSTSAGPEWMPEFADLFDSPETGRAARLPDTSTR